MYKKIFLIILSLLFLNGCSFVQNNSNNITNSNDKKNRVKSVWMSYYELSEFTKEHTEQEFQKDISSAFKNLYKEGFNRITVQVRPYADAMYKSEYFPISSYFSGEQGSELTYDPLEIMCETASKYKLEIEAWINPYRVSSTPDFEKLSEDNIALEWKNSEKLFVLDNGIYFNPACSEVQELIINGVKELAQGYNVSSICFDDYFYPSKDEELDKELYDEYIKSGGELTQSDWRRNNVSTLIRNTYSAIKDINDNISFGISPSANISNNYESLYADVKLWCSEEGYIDYINPQIYFGFQNENQPFMSTVKEWIKTAESCDLYISLPLYKAGYQDEFAGERGENEFIENNNIISRQVIYLSKLDDIDGFYIFSYSFLNDSEESKNLYSAMQKSFE